MCLRNHYKKVVGAIVCKILFLTVQILMVVVWAKVSNSKLQKLGPDNNDQLGPGDDDWRLPHAIFQPLEIASFTFLVFLSGWKRPEIPTFKLLMMIHNRSAPNGPQRQQKRQHNRDFERTPCFLPCLLLLIWGEERKEQRKKKDKKGREREREKKKKQKTQKCTNMEEEIVKNNKTSFFTG